MVEDPQGRLESYGQKRVPEIDPAFADRLESHLRAEHAERAPSRWRRAGVLLPRLAAAAAVAVAGFVGVAALIDDDPGVPVAVIDQEDVTPLDVASNDGEGGGPDTAQSDVSDSEGDAGALAADPTPSATPTDEPTGTPTAAPVTTSASPVPAPTSTPAAAPTPTPSPTVVAPTATPTPPPAASTTPTPTVTAVPPPTPTAAPTATPIVIATPQPVPSPTASPTPTPTVEREPAPIALGCEARVAGDAVGVVCTWGEPAADRPVAAYRLSRSRNSDTIEVVSLQRANGNRTYVDRDIESGDQVIYIVHGLDADDRVVAASQRQVVTVPTRD